MDFQVNFGTINVAASKSAAGKSSKFRLALLGDFSGAANRGRLETGSQLAGRKALRVDAENLDAVIGRLKIKLALPIAPEGGAVELSIGSMDDLHPEQLYSNLEIFGALSGLRQRLKSVSSFAKAAQELQSWTGAVPVPPIQPGASVARGSVIATDARLADFKRLVGRPSVPAAKATASLKGLLQQVVGPYVVPAKDSRQDAMVAAVDEALSGTMRSVLHHPDFQAIEALWRSVDFIVRRLETDESLEVVLYDISAEELAADLSQGDALENSGLYQLLVEQPGSDVHQGPLSAIVGLYTFERTPPHAELLGRLAKIVARAPAAFISSVSSDCLDQNPKDLHPLIKDAWKALRAIPESGYLGLACPRFLLRLPYGAKTEPIDAFDFEEFTAKTGLRGMLWGNPAVIAGLLLGETFARQGAKMQLGSVLSVGDMPFHYFTDNEGDQVALPCTERLIVARLSTLLSTQALIPLVCMKGAPEVRLGGFGSVAGPQIGGPWAPISIPSPSPAAAEKPPIEEPKPEPAKPKAEAEPAVPSDPSPAPVEASAVQAEAPAPAPEPATASAEPASSSGGDELDTLLTSLTEEKEKKEEENKEAEIDPDLAALLADLK
ncbi:MAG: type VI secretion system contractile sheath large subunit [Chthoniobacter sp.]